MKTKTDAAKVLLEQGWTFEEIQKALGEKGPIVIREVVRERDPYPYYPPLSPYVWPYQGPFTYPKIWMGVNQTITTSSLKMRDSAEDAWDRQIEADVKAGKFDKFAQEARAAHARGETTPL